MITVKLVNQFDRKKVIDRMEQKERKVLFQVGAFARRTMQRSMRRGGKTSNVPSYYDEQGRRRAKVGGRFLPPTASSRPGEPPRYYSKHLRNLIRFNVDARFGYVDVGPTLYDARDSGKLIGVNTTPQLINEGGYREIRVKTRTGKKIKKRLKYRPRPFVGPVLIKAVAVLQDRMRRENL